MKHFLVLFLFLNHLWLIAQIGPCSIDGGSDELEIYLRSDKLPDQFDLGSPGENNMWIFNSLHSPRTETYKYARVENSRYGQYFDRAEMALREPNGKEIFYENKGGNWYEIGYARLKANSLEPEIVLYTVPINTCTTKAQSRPTIYETGYTEAGRIWIKSYEDIKDASGVLYLPDAYYDAERIRRITNSVSGGVRENQISYIFTEQLTGTFLMEVKIGLSGKAEEIIYKSKEANVPAHYAEGSSNFMLYPDVGYGDVRIEFNNFNAGTYSLVLFDIIGRKLWSKDYIIEFDTTIKEDLSFLPKGRYHYTIIDSDQNKIVTRRLAIIKS